MPTAYLALGSNQGDRRDFLEQGRAALESVTDIEVVASSPLYVTEPVGGPSGQDSYYNAVLKVETALEPRLLLNVCQDIERKSGRVRSERWGSRTLDIDILFYEEIILNDPGLQIPHPRLHLRRFVLAPLNDIAPEFIHPLLAKSVRDLLNELPEGEEVRRLGPW